MDGDGAATGIGLGLPAPAGVRSERAARAGATRRHGRGRDRDAYRVLETSHPPTWYLPRDSVSDGVLERSAAASTWCEWKGAATYWDVLGLTAAAWSYETPSPGYEAIAGYVTFYPARLACSIDGEPVRPQEGGFYGGWITSDVVGPFKGAPGTLGW